MRNWIKTYLRHTIKQVKSELLSIIDSIGERKECKGDFLHPLKSIAKREKDIKGECNDR